MTVRPWPSRPESDTDRLAEWVPINDNAKKYAGEVFLEMTYYDQTRKAPKAKPVPADGSYGGPGEFESMPSPGKPSGSMGRTSRLSSLQPGAANSLRSSISHASLTANGIEPYTPNYAPAGLVVRPFRRTDDEH